jgi:pimeloyl-ACP methyl ester carboxylesterase
MAGRGGGLVRSADAVAGAGAVLPGGPGAVTEHPLFVPAGGEHLAAILAVPSGEARALVLLLPGFGVGRSHKARIWTLAARRLAERDIASIRLDYPGHGDSTGSPASVELDAPALDEAVAAAEVGKALVGAAVLGVVGNCFGARTAVALAEHRDDCLAAALVMPGGFNVLLEPRPRKRDRFPVGVGASIRRALRGRGAPARAPAPGGDDGPERFIPDVARALASTDLLFVLPGIEERRRVLQQAVDDLAASNGTGGRVTVEVLRATNNASANIPVEAQPALVDMVTDWMDRSLPGSAADGASPAGPEGT